MSLRRQHPWMLSHIAARDLFQAGVFILPAYLLQGSFVVRVGQVLLFALAARIAGKRIQWGYFLVVVGTITAFHLLTPSGRVLYQLSRFRVTTGALQTGLFKGFTIAGMVFLSLASVRADLRLPGRFGNLVGKTFWSFERIMERRGGIERGAVFGGVDRLLNELYDELLGMDADAADVRSNKMTAERSSVQGYAVLIGLVALQWALLLRPW